MSTQAATHKAGSESTGHQGGQVCYNPTSRLIDRLFLSGFMLAAQYFMDF